MEPIIQNNKILIQIKLILKYVHYDAFYDT
jgi:hypothetical protein